MKKILAIIVLGLFWCNAGFAELIELNKCFKMAWSESVNPKKFFGVKQRYEQHKFSINTATGLITRQEIFTDEHVYKYNLTSTSLNQLNKVELTEFELANYTSDLIIGRKYITDPSLIELLKYPNLKIVQWEIRINLRENSVYIIEGAMGHDPFDYNKHFKPMGYSYQQFIDLFKDMKRTFDIKCDENTSGSETGTSNIASGTAFFINNKGNLLTNNHVVDGCIQSKINYLNKEYDAQILATDKTLDLALLKVNLVPKSYLSFSGSMPKKLQKIYVAGYPFGKGLSDDLKITDGIISSLKGVEDNSNELQVSAPINHGNSGGPIVGQKGELVGIAVSGLAKEISEGINFGIKSSAAANFLSVNEIQPSVSNNRSIDDDKLLKILEESTVYTYCEIK